MLETVINELRKNLAAQKAAQLAAVKAANNAAEKQHNNVAAEKAATKSTEKVDYKALKKEGEKAQEILGLLNNGIVLKSTPIITDESIRKLMDFYQNKYRLIRKQAISNVQAKMREVTRLYKELKQTVPSDVRALAILEYEQLCPYKRWEDCVPSETLDIMLKYKEHNAKVKAARELVAKKLYALGYTQCVHIKRRGKKVQYYLASIHTLERVKKEVMQGKQPSITQSKRPVTSIQIKDTKAGQILAQLKK